MFIFLTNKIKLIRQIPLSCWVLEEQNNYHTPEIRDEK
jgi:hypothetical protein